jgi:HEAT repeat protein
MKLAPPNWISELPIFALLCATVLLAGCDPGSSGTEPRSSPPPPLSPVVAGALEAHAGELEALADPGDALQPDPVLLRRARELSRLAAESADAFRDAAKSDLVRIGPDPQATADALAAVILDEEVPGEHQRMALEALAQVDADAAGAHLVGLMKLGHQPWIRSHCAWHLGQRAEQHRVPELILQLRYEKDHETAVWIAWALAQNHCYAGLDALYNVSSDGSSPFAEQARGILAELAAELGLEDASQLHRAWFDGDQAGVLPEVFLEPRTEAVLWRWIARLNSFQLRPVDDTRFIFERCWAPAADLLAEALFDESSYVRLHVAQCLQRMGPRAQRARVPLERALGLPDTAPWVAEALGSLGDPSVRLLLEARLGPEHPPELRVAAARGLAYLGLPESLGALRAALDQAPFVELEQGLLEAQVYVGAGDEVVERLVEFLDREWIEPATTERALGFLIDQWVSEDRPGSAEVREAWLAADGADDRPTRRRNLLTEHIVRPSNS